MKIRKAIPHVLTSANLACGVIAIILSLKGGLSWAPWFIFLAAFFDFFDGFAARLLKVSGDFGKQLDSLADVVTFGVAPGLIVFQFLQLAHYDFEVLDTTSSIDELLLQIPQDEIYNGAFIAVLIPVFSALRLAKFNIDKRQSDSFIGLPTPANAILFAAFPLMFNDALITGEAWKLAISSVLINDTALMNFTVLFSLLLVLELPLFALKFKSYSIRENGLKYSFLLISLVLLLTLLYWALPLIIILYVILSIVKFLT